MRVINHIQILIYNTSIVVVFKLLVCLLIGTAKLKALASKKYIQQPHIMARGSLLEIMKTQKGKKKNEKQNRNLQAKRKEKKRK
jgi:hypothetical protein